MASESGLSKGRANPHLKAFEAGPWPGQRVAWPTWARELLDRSSGSRRLTDEEIAAVLRVDRYVRGVVDDEVETAIAPQQVTHEAPRQRRFSTLDPSDLGDG